MVKRLVLIGLGSHVALTAMSFMILAGSQEIAPLARIAAMTGVTAWAGLVLLVLLLTYRTWEHSTQLRRAGMTALALPGWTLGLPVVMLYLLRPHDGDGWTASTE